MAGLRPERPAPGDGAARPLEERRAHLGPRRRQGQSIGEKLRDPAIAREPPRGFGVGLEERLDSRTFRGVERAEGVARDLVPLSLGVFDHGDSRIAPGASTRGRNISCKRSSPLRMRVFTVPSGWPWRAAISRWVRPP